MADVKELAEQLVNLSVKEVNELTEVLKEEYGIEPAAAPVAAPAAAGGGGGEAEEAEEQTEFDVILKDPGGSKLNVVKLIKDVGGLGLKDAKELVDSTPKAVKEGASKEEAEDLKSKLEEAGATIELK